jgi:hypothetical protein
MAPLAKSVRQEVTWTIRQDRCINMVLQTIEGGSETFSINASGPGDRLPGPLHFVVL